MRTHSQSGLLHTCMLAMIAVSAAANAGPLNPPAGPVGPTAKPLTEVEPRTAINAANTPGDPNSVFRITQPGSYYLASNLLGLPGKRGIEIGASNVTIDLNGFTVDGQGDPLTLDGITTDGTVSGLVIRNGSVSGWGEDGIDVDVIGAAAGKRIEHIVARNNINNGISAGDSAAVTDCTAFANGAYGIIMSSSAVVTNCVSRGNTSGGISVGSGCTVTACSSRANGATGIQTGTGCSVSDCTALGNAGNGIFAGTQSTVTDCTSSDNSQIGISVGNGCTITTSTACGNATYGISASFGCSVLDCTAHNNWASGIIFAGGSTIRGNTCRTNGNGGIGAGIWSSSSDSRIEGNTCSGGDYGIWLITGSRNVIVRNQCGGAGTLNWSIAANNIYGPIIDRSAAATASVSGDSAASTLATTDPNANFTN